jgi:ribonuclease HII
MDYPNFNFERRLIRKGYKNIAGVDEVGRGCFAGPIVAGCVIFSIHQALSLAQAGPVGSSSLSTSSLKLAGAQRDSLRFRHPPKSKLQIPDSILINDSKQLTPKQREKANDWIRKNALAVGIGQASVAQINRLGIKKASEIAFRKAIKNAGGSISGIQYLLVDAFYIPYVKGLRRKNQLPIVKGDTKSFSIAAASIVAKVHRDRLMINLSRRSKYKSYHWNKNKGYGTWEHRKAIKKNGMTQQHRKQFVETWLKNLKSRDSNRN